jgi:histidinol-phosphatase (PHP family)
MIEVKYNYHSHTYRCGHASRCSDEDYVLEAIEHGYKKYGFSDHVSVHPIFY